MLPWPYPRVECEAHGWQDAIMLTRYDRRAKPRDVPDRFLCILCQTAGTPVSAGNSIRIGPETPPAE